MIPLPGNKYQDIMSLCKFCHPDSTKFKKNLRHEKEKKRNKRLKIKKNLKNYTSMYKQKCIGHKGKLLFWFVSYCPESEFSLHSLSFYFSIEAQFLRFFYSFSYLPIFTDKKSLDVIILLIIWFLYIFFFFVILFHLVFLSTPLASLPPGVILLNRSTALRDSATEIKKHPEKGARVRAT